jgi:hypothetical protein
MKVTSEKKKGEKKTHIKESFITVYQWYNHTKIDPSTLPHTVQEMNRPYKGQKNIFFLFVCVCHVRTLSNEAAMGHAHEHIVRTKSVIRYLVSTSLKSESGDNLYMYVFWFSSSRNEHQLHWFSFVCTPTILIQFSLHTNYTDSV